jgi:hypothetical protein
MESESIIVQRKKTDEDESPEVVVARIRHSTPKTLEQMFGAKKAKLMRQRAERESLRSPNN